MVDDVDFGEDFDGEIDDDEDMKFVEQAQMDAVNKRLEEQDRVNETLRSLITDVSLEFDKFKTLISPESQFSFERYIKDLEF
jgi:hypothetical protein